MTCLSIKFCENQICHGVLQFIKKHSWLWVANFPWDKINVSFGKWCLKTSLLLVFPLMCILTCTKFSCFTTYKVRVFFMCSPNKNSKNVFYWQICFLHYSHNPAEVYGYDHVENKIYCRLDVRLMSCWLCSARNTHSLQKCSQENVYQP